MRRAAPRSLAVGLLVVTCVLALLTGCSPTPPPEPAAPGPTPPIRHLGASTATTNRPSTSLRLTQPAGTAAGVVLVAQIAVRRKPSATVLPPDGWTEAGTAQDKAQLTSAVFWRVAGASEPDAYEFTTAAPSPMVGSISGFADVDVAEPVDAVGGNPVAGSAAGSSELTGPALTTDVGNTVAIWFGTQVTAACPKPPLTPPAGFRGVAAACNRAGPGLALTAALRQLGAGSVQPRWRGRTSASGPGLVQVLTLRPVGSPTGDGRVPGAQAADRFADRPAPSLTEPKPFGYQLWDGTGAAKKPNVDIPTSVLFEPSGLAASRTDNQVVFVNGEKDGGTLVAVSTRDGQVLGRYTVTVPGLFDWEDLAAGPCPAGQCLFAGNIGSSRGVPKPDDVFSVTRFAEPDVAGGQSSGQLSGETFPFRYPGGIRPDAEAMLVHPGTGDIYVISKGGRGTNDVYRFPNPLPPPGQISELVLVATLRLPTDPSGPEAAQVTAAAAHPVANRLLIRTYRHVYEYRGPQGAPFLEALTGERVELTDPREAQGEAITYAIDGSAYYTLSEAQRPPYRLNRADRT